MIIKLPSSFPLRQVEVDSGPGGRAGVTDARWRAWLLSASAVMFAQNGSVLDAVMVFKKNIGAHFEGVEDCAICKCLSHVEPCWLDGGRQLAKRREC